MRGSFARGFTLLELIIASAIFVLVSIAVGTFYLATVKGFERGSAQGYVQRVGSQIESELVRHVSRAVAFHGGKNPRGTAVGPACGPAGATVSFIFERPLLNTAPPGVHPCRYCCVYQAIETTFAGHPNADKFPQLYMCTIPDVISGAPIGCSPNTEIRQLTAGPPRNRDTGENQVAIESAIFTLVTSICAISPYEPCNQATSPGACSTDTAASCVPASAPRVEIQFLICQPDPQASTTTPCTDTTRPPVFSPLRFGLTATARN